MFGEERLCTLAGQWHIPFGSIVAIGNIIEQNVAEMCLRKWLKQILTSKSTLFLERKIFLRKHALVA